MILTAHKTCREIRLPHRFPMTWTPNARFLELILKSLPKLERLPCMKLKEYEGIDGMYSKLKVICEHGKALSKVKVSGILKEVPTRFLREFWSKFQLCFLLWTNSQVHDFDNNPVYLNNLVFGMSVDFLSIHMAPAPEAALSLGPLIRRLVQTSNSVLCTFNAKSLESSESFVLEVLQVLNTRVSSLSQIAFSISNYSPSTSHIDTLIRHDYLSDSLQRCIARLPQPLSPVAMLLLRRKNSSCQTFHLREVIVGRGMEWGVTMIHIEIEKLGLESRPLWNIIAEACPCLTNLRVSLTTIAELDVDLIVEMLVCIRVTIPESHC
jgi:hypothetical protein